MLSIPERVQILRTVNLFVETPEAVLAEVAELLEPVTVRAAETILNKGDYGDCMYLIIEGRVLVHDGDLVLNQLAERDAFGEMAMLDAEPRVASVTAMEDTLLFRLDQAPFYRLVENRMEIARGVIGMLCRHLRDRVRNASEDFLYIQQMGRIMAAAADLEAGMYDPCKLDEVGRRGDALGQLARVFQRMAREVYTREQQLRQQIHQLTIEVNEARKEREVMEIVETEYFQDLQKRAKEFRDQKKHTPKE